MFALNRPPYTLDTAPDAAAAGAFHSLWQSQATADAATFWARQFRSSTDTAFRCRCLSAYFTLLPVPTTVEQKRTDLADPTWTSAAEIAIVHGVGGRIPVHLKKGETVFCIGLPTPTRGAIYLGTPTTRTEQELRHALA